MTILLLMGMILVSKRLSELAVSGEVEEQKDVIVIDPGHGGTDPGKVGVNGVLEKEINLQIAGKVKQELEKKGYQVIMTRETDDSSESKREDMKKRVELINDVMPVLTVSIHQNSYTDPSVNGAQVFYYTNSTEGQNLAALIQKSLITIVDPTNHRTEKSNNSYYLLKNVKAPIVIVECGFLSNWEESKKLVDDTYQQKLAWAIHLGILQYLNGVNANLHILK